jgi:predicted TIM-barrel fold metal-dependent hydrolase
MTRTLITLLLSSLIAVPSGVAAQELYDGPIIDMHLHAQGSIWAEQQLCYPEPCEGGGVTIAKDGAEVRSMTLKAMDQHNIVLGFLSGDLALVAEWTAAAPDRFLASPTINDPMDADLDQLRKEYTAGRLAGMGEIATQYHGYAPSDSEVIPFFALAAEFDVPAHVHTLGIGAPLPRFRVSNGDPRFLEEVLVQYPALRIFVENCGFPFADEMTAMMYQYPQLYCDVSTILHLTPRPVALRYLKEMVNNGLGKRVMYGSDQMIWPEVIGVVIDAIQTADFLTREQKADIFYNNAARFLRLSDKQISAHHQH